MDTFFVIALFGDNITHYKTESLHFLGHMNSATKVAGLFLGTGKTGLLNHLLNRRLRLLARIFKLRLQTPRIEACIELCALLRPKPEPKSHESE